MFLPMTEISGGKGKAKMNGTHAAFGPSMSEVAGGLRESESLRNGLVSDKQTASNPEVRRRAAVNT